MAEHTPIRVAVADDSPLACDLLVRMLRTDPDIVVVGIARSGQIAIDLVRRLRPNLLTLDWSTPGIDAATAVERIMTDAPTPILVITGHPIRNSGEARRLLRAGVLDIVEKPFRPGDQGETAIQRLTRHVHLLAGVDVTTRRPRPVESGVGNARLHPDDRAVSHQPAPALPRLSPTVRGVPREVVGVVASTGGPLALTQVLRKLPVDFSGAVLVVQHIAPGFIRGLAEFLGADSHLPVQISAEGAPIRGGQVLLAPDGYHLTVGPSNVVHLVDSPPVMSLRPCGDLLLASLSTVYGSRAVGVVLTGMGADGARGLLAIRQAGGYTITQDQATSAIFGMPQEAIRLGGATEVLPIDAIGQRLVDLFNGEGGDR